jgi:hypothetical protein
MKPKRLQRTTEFLERYQLWLTHDFPSHLAQCQSDFEKIAFSTGPISDKEASIKRFESQTYFIWSPTFKALQNATIDTGSFLMDYFANILRQHRYVLHHSDWRNVNVEGIGAMEFARHYLKPAYQMRLEESKEVHYGNIFIEYTPMLTRLFLKITANHYPGEQVHRFEKLLQLLLTHPATKS